MNLDKKKYEGKERGAKEEGDGSRGMKKMSK